MSMIRTYSRLSFNSNIKDPHALGMNGTKAKQYQESQDIKTMIFPDFYAKESTVGKKLAEKGNGDKSNLKIPNSNESQRETLGVAQQDKDSDDEEDEKMKTGKSKSAKQDSGTKVNKSNGSDKSHKLAKSNKKEQAASQCTRPVTPETVEPYIQKRRRVPGARNLHKTSWFLEDQQDLSHQSTIRKKRDIFPRDFFRC